ncbi:hypothetical protein [Bosea sp. (in: a-proteobacteria)]|uniref:hypothetical protein n=1 Tax=Bosea sp. (in: a-proteobacteria) TaxID=1871050 RepID=UPI00262A0F2A|nr:hypothetical protein [Bosea sp. (in: a-proteobacteria)]MCO5092086.1 hypothetical protein [Bosea sp. (in: a-proteobacteria)]
MTSYQQSTAGSPDVVVSVLRIDCETMLCVPLSDEQASVAVAAAKAAFAAAGVTADLVATADWEVEGWDIAGFPEAGPGEWFDIAMVKGDAHRAADQALAARWPELQGVWTELRLYAPDEPA